MSDFAAPSAGTFSILLELLSRDSRDGALRLLQERGLVNEASLPQWRAELADPRNEVKSSPMTLGPLMTQLRAALEKNGGELSPGKIKSILMPMAKALTFAGKRDALDHSRLAGRTALDFGAGVWSPMSCAIALYANGFDRALAYEPFPIDVACVVENVLQTVLWLLQDPASFNLSGISESEMKRRVAALDLSDLGPRFAAFNADGSGVVDLGGVALIGSLDRVEPGSVDLVFSNAVLEHLMMPLPEMQRLYALMRDDGVGVHTVDFSDHRAWEVDGPVKNHFQLYYDGELETTNGLRPSEIEAVFAAAGFGGTRINLVNAPSGYVDPDRPRLSRYQDFPVEELSVMVNTYILTRTSRTA